jgi:hypothetical protein
MNECMGCGAMVPVVQRMRDSMQMSMHMNYSKKPNGKLLSILHILQTLHQVIITCFSTSRNFRPATVRNEQEGKEFVHAWLKGLVAMLFEKRHTKAGPII